MSAWSNIETSLRDHEILRIDEMEKSLEGLPEKVTRIRDLITRFEACHFKYKQHYINIQKSIEDLKPVIDPGQIGSHHIHQGSQAVQKDTTGRSRIAQHFLFGLYAWLGEGSDSPKSSGSRIKSDDRVSEWLGDKQPDKARLVRLLIARLTWDWKAMEDLMMGGDFEAMENQLIRMDTCHYDFPRNLERLLEALGQMKPVDNFEGCGTYSQEIKTYFHEQFTNLCQWMNNNSGTDVEEKTRFWLTACLAKTIKVQLSI